MLFDTDVLIWYLRGNVKSARTLENAPQRQVSVVSYMELLQGARDKQEVKIIRDFFKQMAFESLPITENISHRAVVYMEEYGLKVQMCLADALLAATAVEHALTLCTANQKHYKAIRKLELFVFRP